jgi:hypothetical protein
MEPIVIEGIIISIVNIIILICATLLFEYESSINK